MKVTVFRVFVGCAAITFLLCAAFLVLNHYRNVYYNTEVQNLGSTPYGPIIHAQEWLGWPIVISACITLVAGIVAFVRLISMLLARRRTANA
jgi:hypothetical protein